ncbi:hypothetical protein ABH902_002940 [Enterococcus sp. UD-01]|jgi:hypothetical protein
MFTCTSYILKPGTIVTMDNLKCNFVSIDNLKEISIIKSNVDLFYVEGAICLKYIDEEILGRQHWDLVDQLWSYLVEMISMVIEKGQSETYFPDQPIKLEMNRIANNQILFSMESSEVKKWNVPEQEFFSILLKSAKEFFNFMINEFPETIEEYKNELIKIEDLMKKTMANE